MGDWKIEITGVGQHHNNQAADADAIAKETVNRLRAAGHTLNAAVFTTNDGTSVEPLED